MRLASSVQPGQRRQASIGQGGLLIAAALTAAARPAATASAPAVDRATAANLEATAPATAVGANLRRLTDTASAATASAPAVDRATAANLEAAAPVTAVAANLRRLTDTACLKPARNRPGPGRTPPGQSSPLHRCQPEPRPTLALAAPRTLTRKQIGAAQCSPFGMGLGLISAHPAPLNGIPARRVRGGGSFRRG
jgi:hypothetical protein